MKILFHSKSGDSAGLWYRMQQEGAKVSAYIKEGWARRVMSGIVPHVETLEEGLAEKPDVIVFDLNGDGKRADDLRKDGYKVVCGGSLMDKMEMDRAYGVNLAKQYGIKVPATTEFNDVESAIDHVKKTKKAYAIKIDNNQSESSSYVGKDAQDMLDYLEYSKEERTVKKGNKFILQEKVDGSEVSTEVWFSNGVPVLPANSTWETKKLLAGELGVRTGCEVSIVCHYEGHSSRLVDQTVAKLFPLLKYARYTGPLDVNAIVSEKDHEAYFLELTPRLGYSAIYGLLAILGIPLSEFFYRISRGTFAIPFKANWGSSLKIHIPPYPVEIEDKRVAEETYGKSEGVRINGKYGDDFTPIDVQKGTQTDFVCAGTSCIVGECLGRGNSLFDAWKNSQKVFKTVDVPNMGGRYTDGAEDAWKRILKLRNWGFTDIPNPSGKVSAGNQEISLNPLKRLAVPA